MLATRRYGIAVAVLGMLAFKLSGLLYLRHLTHCSHPNRTSGTLAVIAGDTASYLGSVDNLIETGTYFFWNGSERVFASRMPYYGAPYYVLRLFLDREAARDGIVLLQIMLDGVGVVALALLARRAFSSEFAFWATLVSYTVSADSSIWSLYLLPESLSISSLCLFLLAYHRYLAVLRWEWLAGASALFAVVVLLKPYFVVLYIVLAVEVGVRLRSRRETLLAWSVLGLALALPLAPWIMRNHLLYKKFVPFQINMNAGFDPWESHFAYLRFVRAWGGNPIWWEKRSAGCYFRPGSVQCEFELPEHALAAAQYTLEDVQTLRERYIAFQAHPTRDEDQAIAKEFDRLTSLYRRYAMLDFYFLSPLRLAKQLVLHSGSYYLPIGQASPCYAPWQLSVKALVSLLYYSCLVVGVPGLLLAVWRGYISVVTLAVPGWIVALFCLLHREGAPEFRYFIHAYPVLLLGTVFALDKGVRAVLERGFAGLLRRRR